MSTVPSQDVQTVTPEGALVQPLIDGLKIKYAITLPDDRGTLCEIYNPAWDFSQAPLVYVYQVTIRPGKIKGWVKHLEQDDRLFISYGAIRIALYDDRAESPTYKMINTHYLSEHNRGLILIPKGIYHLLQNVGTTDAVFINLPTKPYNYLKPDKYRLPANNDLIPYCFETGSGQ